MGADAVTRATRLTVPLLLAAAWLVLGGADGLAWAGPADTPTSPAPTGTPDAGRDAEPDWGPLAMRTAAPLYLLRLAWTPGPVATLAPGALRFKFGVLWANYWGQYDEYFSDGEWGRFTPAVAFGVAPGIELRAELPILFRGAGSLDGFIEGFHRLFGVTQARRDRFPRDQLHFRREQEGAAGVVLDNGDQDFGLGDITLGVTVEQKLAFSQVLPDGLALTGDLLLRLPTGNARGGFASDGMAIGLAANVAYDLSEDVRAYGTLGGAWHATDRIFGVPMRKTNWWWLLGVGWRVSARVRIVGQFLWQEGIAHGFGQLQYGTHEIGIGVQWAPGRLQSAGAGAAPAWRLELGLVENTILHGNTADLAFHLALIFDWP